MQALYDLINKRAEATFKQELSMKNWDAWSEHWFNTAFEIWEECLQEELTETASYLAEIIAEQRKLIGYKNERRNS